MPTSSAPTTPSARARRISLTIVLGAAVVDAVFLVALLIALAVGSSAALGVLAPLYGFGFAAGTSPTTNAPDPGFAPIARNARYAAYAACR